jgi:ATP-binding cassette subfamily B protein
VSQPSSKRPGGVRAGGFSLGLLKGAVTLTLKADRRGFMLSAALQFVGSLAPAGLILIGQRLINELIRHDGRDARLSALLPLTIALAVVSAVVSATAALQQQQQRLLAERVSATTWEGILDVTSRVPFERFEDPKFYDQLQRIKNNAISQPLAVTNSLFGLLGSTVSTTGLLVVVLSISPILAAALLFAGVPTLLVARRTSRIEFAFLVSAMPAYRARQYLRDVLSGRAEAKEIRVFGAERALRARHEQRRERFDDLLAHHTRRRIRYALLTVGCSALFLVLALGLTVALLRAGSIGLADAAAAILAVRFLATSLDQLFRSLGGLFEASTYLADLADFLRQSVPASKTEDGLGPLTSSITLRDVGFTYPGTDRAVLHDVNLEIGANEVVALVGENGSGKTTLAKLIAGLYAPTTGAIAWNGNTYAGVPPHLIHDEIAIIFQDFVRYQLSALDNIGLGDPDRADDLAAAERAADQANALTFLTALPRGMETMLSREFEDGADLSIGQWQRIALARALRKRASLIVLDEPSASLDPRAEAKLFADLREMMRGRTVLLITHRFSSVRLADRIYVLSEGRVVEQGTHGQLTAARGLYADLYALQAAAYDTPLSSEAETS